MSVHHSRKSGVSPSFLPEKTTRHRITREKMNRHRITRSNVSLIQLPPYSPELNPVENLWHYLRAHHWSNRPYRDYDALQEEAVRSLCAVREDTETIKTVCNPPYISRGA